MSGATTFSPASSGKRMPHSLAQSSDALNSDAKIDIKPSSPTVAEASKLADPVAQQKISRNRLLIAAAGAGAAVLALTVVLIALGATGRLQSSSQTSDMQTAKDQTANVSSGSSSAEPTAVPAPPASTSTTTTTTTTTTSTTIVRTPFPAITPGPGGPFTCKTSCLVAMTNTVNPCVSPNMFALTYDDGPYKYTAQLLDILDNLNVRATFFINGANWDSIYNHNASIQRMYKSGHQIASHTWSHSNSTAITNTAFKSEITKLEDALKAIIGVKPTFFRPPYGAYSTQNINTLGTLGYRWAVAWNSDPKDFDSASTYSGDPALMNVTVANKNLANDMQTITQDPSTGNYIHLSHDVWAPTVAPYTEMLVNWLRSIGYTNFVSVAECLGETMNNAYKL